MAQIPQVVNLTKVVKQPGVNWNDFWVGERDVATVNGKVIGIPALVDNLAVVYNKTLFAQAHLPLPSPDWTWTQFVADAKKLTDPASKQFGTAYVTPGTEDTVWHWEALLWEAGGQLLTADNKKAAFDSAAGLQSLNTLRTMAVADKSMYLDPTDSAYANLFNSGKIGMLVTGPWDLSAFPNVHYGVQVMPAYPGAAAATRPSPGRTTGSCSTTAPRTCRRRSSSCSGSPRPPRSSTGRCTPGTCRPGRRWGTRRASTRRWTPRCPG